MPEINKARWYSTYIMVDKIWNWNPCRSTLVDVSDIQSTTSVLLTEWSPTKHICFSELYNVWLWKLLIAYSPRQMILSHTYTCQHFLSCSGADFMNDLSVLIQNQTKFQSALIQLVVKWSLWKWHMAWYMCCRGMCKIWIEMVPYNGYSLTPIFRGIRINMESHSWSGP